MIKIRLSILLFLSLAAVFLLGIATQNFFKFNFENNYFTSPFVSNDNKEMPLQQYSIENLRQREYQTSPITLERILEENSKFTSYLFSYHSTDKRITGQINVPVIRAYAQKPKTILMLRGYVPTEEYETGMGTKNAAAVFANAGYVTLAPDFLGYGGSDAENQDVWEARLIKPVNALDLIESIKHSEYLLAENLELNEEQIQSIERLNGEKAPLNPSPNLESLPAQAGESGSRQRRDQMGEVGIWAHSNGGQIAVSLLEASEQQIPTTLWAPMIAPFPYSILYFGWDEEDEGKEQRKWISLFEDKYNALDFSITAHTDLLKGPLQIQHGSADDQVLTTWVEDFVNKIKEAEDASNEADINYIEYPNTDHNLQPNWNIAIQKDLDFFAKNL